MILQNYWAWRKMADSYPITAVTAISGIVDVGGNNISQLYMTSNSSGLTWVNVCLLTSTVYGEQFASVTTPAPKLHLGSGTTTPTATDYALDTDESSNFTITGTNTITYSDDGMQILFAVSVTNTSNAAITVSEIGISKFIRTASSTNAEFLMTREVLDTPITIEAGATKTINYTWTMQ